MEGGKFLKPSQIKAEAKKWQKQVNKKERRLVDLDSSVYKYNVFRQDGKGEGLPGGGIDFLHGISFVAEVIPGLIVKNLGRKIKILDVGAGMTVFTNQIRNTFGDAVKVYSTGLSKQAFKAEKEKIKGSYHDDKSPDTLHPDDLKWRSVRELSDFPEFDLIVDTYGEFAYSRNESNINISMSANEFPRIFEYISIVIAKLMPGGLASIAPLNFMKPEDKDEFEVWLRQANKELGASFDLFSRESGFVLRIRKPVLKQV